MSVESKPWLVAIDLQRAFAQPGSPWFSPATCVVANTVTDLVSCFGDRVVFTRFVPPRAVEGSWRSYYEKWRFALGSHDSDLWSVIEPWERYPSISSHTFSKWVPELRTLIGPDPSIVLCGVSTDCCVLATAYAAIDGGAQVCVVEDACAAKTAQLHEGALQMMRARSPQLSVMSCEAVLHQHRCIVTGAIKG